MSRWEPDAAARLERAAIDLFAEQGYAATTVPQITARAGLTTRTFYLHFVDKREVLFLREREFPAIVSTLLAEAPDSLPPLGLVMYGFEAVARGGLDRLRDGLRSRRCIIRSDRRLQERELLKSRMLREAIEESLIAYGLDRSDAALAAAYGVMIFDVALNDWLDAGEELSLTGAMRAARKRMDELAA